MDVIWGGGGQGFPQVLAIFISNWLRDSHAKVEKD